MSDRISINQPMFESADDTLSALHFILPVWGDAYIQDWLQLSVASQLAANNLPAISLPVVYHIVTDADGKQQIQQAPNYQALCDVAEVRFHDIQPLKTSIAEQRQYWRRYTDQDWFKYALKMAVIQYGCDLAYAEQAGLIVLMSDIIFANGALGYIEQQALLGAECVLVGSFRVTQMQLRQALTQFSRDGVITVDAQTLQDVAIPLLHPYSLANSRDSQVFNVQWCDYLYWHHPEQVILQRGVFCYPLFMNCRQRIQLPMNDTIDTCALPFAMHKTVVVSDSRDCFLFTPSGEQEFSHLPLQAGRFNAENVAYFIASEAKPHHKKFMQQPVVYATSKARQQPSNLARLLEQCEQDFCEINRYLSTFEANPEAFKAASLAAKKQFLGEDWWQKIAAPALDYLHDWRQLFADITFFGTGIETELLLAQSAVHPTRILDNAIAKQGQRLDGVPICSPQQFIEHLANKCETQGALEDKGVLDDKNVPQYCVLILSRHYANQMQAQLEQLITELPEQLRQKLEQHLQIVNLY